MKKYIPFLVVLLCLASVTQAQFFGKNKVQYSEFDFSLQSAGFRGSTQSSLFSKYLNPPIRVH